MTADRISIENAKPDKLHYVVLSAVLFRRPDKRCLILQRAKTEIVEPSKWGVVSGKLEHRHFDLANPSRVNGDLIECSGAIGKCLAEEIAEEAGPDVMYEDVFHPIGIVPFVRPDMISVVLLKHAAIYHMGAIRPNPKAFDRFAWVTAEEAEAYDCILGIPEDIAATIRLFKV